MMMYIDGHYAWPAVNFVGYCVGVFILVGAGCMAYLCTRPDPPRAPK